MIVVVAPYTPLDRTDTPNLGAARKLEIVMSILARTGSRLVLVNSAHNSRISSPQVVRTSRINDVELMEIDLPSMGNKTLGKLINLGHVSLALKAVHELGRPRLYWCYNPYAFEMRFARKAAAVSHAPVVLEFEDWFFARGRGLNAKPFLDYFFWRRAIASSVLTYVFAVNAIIKGRVVSAVPGVGLLPGIVPASLAEIASRQLPFSSPKSRVVVGFFSGLSVEKGADVVLRLAPHLPTSYSLLVTGTGPLTPQYRKFAEEHPTKMEYCGAVPSVELYRHIASSDIIINPHAPTKGNSDGVFPFKVVEAIASGRPLISTDLPRDGFEDILGGVDFVGRSVQDFLVAIKNARGRYMRNEGIVAESAARATARFGEAALLERIRAIMGGEPCSD